MIASGEARTPVLVIGVAIHPAEVPALCELARRLLERTGADLVICDVGAVVDPDGVTIDALARLHLTARRLGRGIRLRRVGGELSDMLTLAGLDDVLSPGPGGRRLEPGRQTEQGEQPGGVQEEGDPGDAAP